MGCVYLATSPSGKQYVGMTTRTLAERWQGHCSDGRRGSSLIFHNAIRKYGADAFTLETLFESDNEQELFEREIGEIARLATLSPRGYNMTVGGDGGELCAEAKARHMEAMLRVQADPEFREKHLIAVNRPDVKARHSTSLKKFWSDSAPRERQSEIQKARFSDPDERALQSARGKELWADPERRARQSEIQNAPQCKMLKSEAIKALHNDPGSKYRSDEYRSLQGAISKARWADPDSRAAQCAKMQALAADPAQLERVLLGKGVARVLANGVLFASCAAAGRALKVTSWFVERGVKKGFFVSVPRHGDPACDAVEETWAIMQWAKANPDHPNVPDWAQPDRPKHGKAPAWAQKRVSEAA